MRILVIAATFVAAQLFGTTLYAQSGILDPLKIVQWSSEIKPAAAKGEYDVTFTAKIQNGWTLYSQFIGKGGPVPTSITFDKNAGVEKVGDAKELAAAKHIKEGIDENFKMKVKKFTDEVKFVQHIKVKDASKPVSGYVEFMTCDHTKCLPPTAYDFNFKLKGTKK